MSEDSDQSARPVAPRRPIKPESKNMAGAVVIGLLSVAAFGGGMWFAYQEGYKAGAKHAPKMVAAADSPTKTAPESAGGTTVPHQDKEVYKRIEAGAGAAPGAVTIRQATEEPLPRPEPSAEAPKSNGVGKPVPLIPQQAAPKPAEPPPQQVAAAAPSADPPPTATIPARPAPTAPAASTGGGWRLQLASLKSEEAAQKSWADLQRKHGAALGDLRSSVVKVDLGTDKGVYYRLFAGPLATREDANGRCDQLKAQKVACLVARN